MGVTPLNQSDASSASDASYAVAEPEPGLSRSHYESETSETRETNGKNPGPAEDTSTGWKYRLCPGCGFRSFTERAVRSALNARRTGRTRDNRPHQRKAS